MAPDIWSRATRYLPQTRYLAPPTRYLPRQPPDICHYSHQISGWVHDPAGGILAPWDQISGLRGQISGHSLPKPRILDRVHGQSRTLTGHPSPRGDAPMSGHGPRARQRRMPGSKSPHIKAPKITKNSEYSASGYPCRRVASWCTARSTTYQPQQLPGPGSVQRWRTKQVTIPFIHFPFSASIWLYKKLVTFQTRVGQTTKHPTHCWTCKQTSCISSHTHPQPCA